MSDESPEREVRVAEILEQVRAGIRQRQAELATVDTSLRRLAAPLEQVQDLQYVVEPDCVSHRALVGRLIVFAKRLVYAAFMRWFMRSLIEQQNAFNRAASLALRDLYERQADQREQFERLSAEIDRLREQSPEDCS